MGIRTKNIDRSHELKLKDNKFSIVDNSDQTKKLQFQVSGITAATTRTITVPDASFTMVAAAGAGTKQIKSTVEFDLDNGAGTTIDFVLMRPAAALTITAARIVYSDATSGTVAAGTAQIGTTVGGTEIVAATAYANTKAVGTTTAMTIASGAVAANTPVIVRHTGVAATQAGKAIVEIEYDFD